MDPGLGLFEFLNEAELQHYYDAFKTDLKIQKPSQIKYVTDEDLQQLGMSRPEQRRLKKFYSKYYPQNYLSKIKRLLGPVKREEGILQQSPQPELPTATPGASTNKHIIPTENITVNKELGVGEFGIVQQGVWTDRGRCIQVAIKCLYKDQMHTNAMEFLKEAGIMHDIDHKNIVRLYGVVLHPQSLMLVTELAPLRSLLECLKETSLRSSFPVLTLCDFAMQICEGMTYLENKRLIHRDLAARNILVFAKNKVKISDFGLSRALGAGKDYYQTNFNVNLKLPIAWCAPECISYLRFTSASDVWAYGVTMWEMFSYGFQPWAAFSGHQILVAIDTPNCQRLEQPECCPREYYTLMLKCWAHEPNKRPKFCDILTLLPDCKPEQVQAAVSSQSESSNKKADQLDYKVNDIITVLDKTLSSNRWKGALNNGSTGFFNPLNTVSYLGSSLPSTSSNYQSPMESNNFRSSLIRNDKDRSTMRRKLRSDMISGPQGEVKHMGHVGLDGAYFGDVSFLEYNNLPKQIVTPYKPSEDLEQMPLINPNSPSHLTGDNSSLVTHSMLLRESIDKSKNIISLAEKITEPTTSTKENNREYGNVDNGHDLQNNCAFNFDTLSIKNMTKFKWPKKKDKPSDNESHSSDVKTSSKSSILSKLSDSVESENQIHDYQEISDEDDHKTSDFEQSLLDEMELMFRSFGESKLDFNHKNETGESSSRFGTSKKKQSVKPISAHDQRTLDSAIALANKLTVKSMNDLEQPEAPNTPTSPAERSKFSFLFPLIGSASGTSQSSITNSFNNGKHESHHKEKRSFSQEAQSVPDIQASLTEESKLAYESLIEQPCRLETTLLKIKQKQVPPLQLNHPIIKNDFKEHKLKDDFLIKNQSIDTPDSVVHNKEDNQNMNPIPVPPRDPNKHIDAGKRHTRKYPLVMQSVSETNEDFNMPIFNTQTSEVNSNTESQVSPFEDISTNNFNINSNFNGAKYCPSLNPFDTPSLHFEAQIENDFNSIDCIDGHNNHELKKDVKMSNIFETQYQDRNTNQMISFIDDSPTTSFQTFKQKDQFYDDQNADSEMNNLMKHSPDRVSVEDLLEFADHKPCGRQRGTDSDEVRIMCKVLNQQVSPENCLLALEFASWNVHRAIKLAKLKFMGLDSPTLYDCSLALEGCEWDVARAAAMLADAADVAQV